MYYLYLRLPSQVAGITGAHIQQDVQEQLEYKNYVAFKLFNNPKLKCSSDLTSLLWILGVIYEPKT